MPYIATTTSVKLNDAKRSALQQAMGEAIRLIPGKSEAWLMLSWKDETPMAFQGSQEPCAICEVKIYGKASPADYDRLTGALCDIMAKHAGVPSSRVYVTYQEIDNWGFDGGNF